MMRYWLRTSFENSKSHIALLFFRVLIGAMILTHGLPKANKVFTGNWQFSDPIGLGPEISLFLASFAEAGCGILIILGLGTRLASIPLIITMAVAAFIRHGDDPFSTKEKALLYLVSFALLFFFGSGKYSVDKWIVSK